MDWKIKMEKYIAVPIGVVYNVGKIYKFPT
jgi:hypothetical protein